MMRRILEDHFSNTKIEFISTSTIDSALLLLKTFSPDIVLFDWWLFDDETGKTQTSKDLILYTINRYELILPVVFTSGVVEDIKKELPDSVNVISKGDKSDLLDRLDNLCNLADETILLINSVRYGK